MWLTSYKIFPSNLPQLENHIQVEQYELIGAEVFLKIAE